MRLLYIDLDTLRPDHLGCYGYHRDTSPNLDRLARDGVRFDNYYCTDAPCLPSRAALMTGQFGIHSGVVGHGGTAADLRLQGAARGFRDITQNGNLPWVLRNAGLRTTSISTFAERHGAWWFNSGFHEMHNVGGRGSERADEVTPVALDWIRRRARDDDWFLHLHYWDPHTVYNAPMEMGHPFADTPLPAWITPEVLEKHQQCVGPHCCHEINMYDDKPNPKYPRHVPAIRSMDDLRRHFDGYDTCIRYTDDHVGQVLNALADAGVLDDTAIIVSSDHAENQGELGIYAEHATADHATCRIPMIVRWPGLQRGHVDRGLHYNLDLAPTLADLLHQPASPRWDGRSYAATLKDGTDTGRDHLVISQCAHVCQRSVRFGDWLWMRTWHDGFHLWPDEMLFNLADDPYQQHDLAPSRRDLCDRAAHLYHNWHEQMMSSMPDGATIDPLQTVLAEGGPQHARRGALKRTGYLEHLHRTGRGWAIDELKRKHPAEFA